MHRFPIYVFFLLLNSGSFCQSGKIDSLISQINNRQLVAENFRSPDFDMHSKAGTELISIGRPATDKLINVLNKSNKGIIAHYILTRIWTDSVKTITSRNRFEKDSIVDYTIGYFSFYFKDSLQAPQSELNKNRVRWMYNIMDIEKNELVKDQLFPEPLDSITYLKETKVFMAFISKEPDGNQSVLVSDIPTKIKKTDCVYWLLQDSSNFTAEEMAYFKSPLEPDLIKQWNSSLIPMSRFISEDSISAVFKDHNKNWPYFYKHFGSGFSKYSAPIFIRNYTYCLIYTSHHCGGLCGEGMLTLFIKEDGKWKRVKDYCRWIS